MAFTPQLKQAWYVASYGTCIIVRADTIMEALTLGRAHDLLHDKPIVMIRHARPDEICLHEDPSIWNPMKV